MDYNYEHWFHLIWLVYPRKQCKGAARKEFIKRCKDALDVAEYVEKLRVAINTYKETIWWTENPHKVPLLSSFIKDEREEDEFKDFMFPDGRLPGKRINLREI